MRNYASTSTVTLIPAQPGYNTIEMFWETDPSDETKGRYQTYLTPILAWKIFMREYEDPDRNDLAVVTPVTLRGFEFTNAVVYPDGRVELPEISYHDSVEDWIRDEIRIMEERKADRLAEKGSSHP